MFQKVYHDEIANFLMCISDSGIQKMADSEDIQPLVCDNGTGMVKVSHFTLAVASLIFNIVLHFWAYTLKFLWFLLPLANRLDSLAMMLLEQFFPVLLVDPATLVLWLVWAKKMLMLAMRLSQREEYSP